MIYKHQYFKLDIKSKIVFDENNKQLRLTGNAYRVLVFLCANKSGTVSQIGEYLDWAKDYDENQMRQYRYKVNSIIGHDIIVYQNGIYSLVGVVEEFNENEQKDRNTDLLQTNDVKLETAHKGNIMQKAKEIKLSKIPAITVSILLLLALFEWPYGFYTFLKIIVTGISIYYGYYLYKVIKSLNFWFWGLVILLILFNPFFPIYLRDKSLWNVIDIITAIFFISLIIKFRK